MALSKVTFVKQAGGIGRPLEGEDHISGLLYYKDTGVALPTGFSTDNAKAVFSLKGAEDLGIIAGHASYGRLWYHVSEFFRIAPKGVLHIGVFDEPVDYAAHAYGEVDILQQSAEGKIRQMGIYLDQVAGVNTAIVAAVQARCDALYSAYMPTIALLAFDISGVADLATLPDLRTSTAPYVSVVIGQDGAATGDTIFSVDDVSVTCLGAVLGTYSIAQVHQSIGWPKRFKPSGTELDVAAFGNGDKVVDTPLALQDTLDSRGYTFLRKIVGLAGSFFNGGPTAVATTSDYAYQPQNRVMDKATRNVYAALAQEINGEVLLDEESGQLSESYVSYLEGLGNSALAGLERDGELSGGQTIIDPTQNVLQTGTVSVTIQLVGVGVSRNLDVNIGFVNQLA